MMTRDWLILGINWFFSVLLIGFVPAIAAFPKWVLKPITFYCLPIISMGIIGICALLLLGWHQYNHDNVFWITLAFALLATLRLFSLWQQRLPFAWQTKDRRLLLIVIAIILPLLPLAGTTAFTHSDAMSSWNYWAQQIYYAHFPTKQHYPMLLPILLSYVYHFWGNATFESLAKVVLVLFPLASLGMLASIGKSAENILWFIIIIVLSVFTPGLPYDFHVSGYADPILAACIACSIALLLAYLNTSNIKQKSLNTTEAKITNHYHLLMAASLCAMVAALVKQPGLLWAIWGFPLVFIVEWITQKQLDLKEASYCLLVIGTALFWIFGPGKHFYHVPGVLHRSRFFQNTGHLNRLQIIWLAAKYWFTKKPGILVLLILAALASLKNRQRITVFFGFVIPGWFLWFAFANYELREAMYLFISCGILIAANDYFSFPLNVFKSKRVNILNTSKSATRTCASFVAIGIIGFFVIGYQQMQKPHLFPFNANKAKIYLFLPGAPTFIYRHLYNQPHLLLWLDTKYMATIFYKHTPFIQTIATNKKMITRILHQNKPNYVLVSNYNPRHQLLEHYLINHPKLAKPISIGNSPEQFKLFYIQTIQKKNLDTSTYYFNSKKVESP